MVVSLEGITYTDAKLTGSLVRESRTVVLISLNLPWNTLSLIMITCALAQKPTHRHRDTAEKNFFIGVKIKRSEGAKKGLSSPGNPGDLQVKPYADGSFKMRCTQIVLLLEFALYSLLGFIYFRNGSGVIVYFRANGDSPANHKVILETQIIP